MSFLLYGLLTAVLVITGTLKIKQVEKKLQYS